jgi:hypothetical protein
MSKANENTQAGFGDSMRTMHSNIMQAMAVIRTRLTDKAQAPFSDSQTMRKLEEVNKLLNLYLEVEGDFTDNFEKFVTHIETFYKKQALQLNENFLVTSGGEALAIASSADPINGVLDPLAMALRGG